MRLRNQLLREGFFATLHLPQILIFLQVHGVVFAPRLGHRVLHLGDDLRLEVGVVGDLLADPLFGFGFAHEALIELLLVLAVDSVLKNPLSWLFGGLARTWSPVVHGVLKLRQL